MKFLFVGDPHNQVRTPANRTDDFHETFRQKVKEVKQIAKEEKVNAVLQAGDFFHAPQYNNDFIMDVVNLWSFVPEKYQLLKDLQEGTGDPLKIAKRLQEDIPYIGPIGNHDLIGESQRSYSKTSLAFLEKLGFMQIPSKEEPIIFTDEDGTKVAITAASYHHGMDEPEFVDDYIIDEKLGDTHIHIVHGYLSHKGLGKFITHTLVDSVKDTKADITLAGHDHIGFAPVEVNGKLFANPGSLTRTKADIKEIERQPKVLILEIADKKVTVKERLLTSAPKGEKVLDRTSILERKSKASKLESIKSIVNKAKLSKGQSVTDIVESVADAEGIEEEITEDVVNRVTEKIEEMGSSDVAEVGDYHLSQIILENFQSHKHSVFDLSEGLNIFTGESSNGKSAIMRGMRWLMDNHGRSQRNSFIRHGADYAKVTAVFDTGLMVSRVINKKAHRDNGWEIYDPLTGETEKGNTRMVDEVRALFGYTKVQYDTDDDLDINFLNQGDGWYFIGDHVTSSKRAKIIGAIFGTHYTDAVMRDLEKNIRQIKQQEKVRENDLSKTKDNIKEFDYLDDVKKTLNVVKDKIKELKELTERKEQIDKLVEKEKQLDKQRTELKVIIKDTDSIDKAKEMLNGLERISADYLTNIRLINKTKQIKEQEKKNSHILEQTKNTEELKTLVGKLESKNEEYQTVVKLLSDRAKVVKEGQSSRKLVKDLGHLDVVRKKAERLQSLSDKFSILSSLNNENTSIQKKAHSELEKIKKYEKLSKDLQNTYKELIEEHGACPTCGQTVSDNTLAEHLTHA